VYAAGIDSAVGAESRGIIRWWGVIWLNPHEINEELGMLFDERTVEQSNWGII
jgi:hypothetical protein